MKPRLNATRAVRELIKAYEPFLADAERRGRRWVIGWGHRATAKEGATITPENAELLLIYDVLQAQQAVDSAVGAALPKPARDALASFAASIGLSAFKVSDVARLAKAGRHREAAAALDSWVRAEEDGRLVVSDRLAERRRAEKTLFLESLEEVAEDADAGAAEEPTLGALVDVDIAFEIEPAAADEAPPSPDDGEAEAEAEAVLDATPEAEHEDPAVEAGDAPIEEDAEAAADDRKSQQDAAIQAVMSRMAGDIAASVLPAAAPDADAGVSEETPIREDDDAAELTVDEGEAEAEAEAEAAPDLTDVRLGFSFMEPARVEVPVDVDTPAEDDAGAADAAPEPAPTPVYATVAVTTVTATPAPPHPSLAPASAPGLSGESEGPDHPEGEDDEAGVEDEALEPAILAGPEAVVPEAEPAQKSDGGWVYPALLAIGMGLTGLGGWELASHWDAYSSLGLEFSPLGPVVFGAGVLLAVGAGWFTFRRR